MTTAFVIFVFVMFVVDIILKLREKDGKSKNHVKV